jgi:hypothetical protein
VIHNTLITTEGKKKNKNKNKTQTKRKTKGKTPAFEYLVIVGALSGPPSRCQCHRMLGMALLQHGLHRQDHSACVEKEIDLLHDTR